MDKYEDSASEILGLNHQTFTLVIVVCILMFLYTVYNIAVAVTFPVRLLCRLVCCCCQNTASMFSDDDDSLLAWKILMSPKNSAVKQAIFFTHNGPDFIFDVKKVGHWCSVIGSGWGVAVKNDPTWCGCSHHSDSKRNNIVCNHRTSRAFFFTCLLYLF